MKITKDDIKDWFSCYPMKFGQNIKEQIDNTEKEIQECDQRNKNQLMIQCHCGGNHWIRLSWYVDEEGYKLPDEKEVIYCDFDISFIDYNKSFWERLRNGFLYIIGKKDKLYFSEIGLTSTDLEKIRTFINDYLVEVHIKQLNKKIEIKENI